MHFPSCVLRHRLQTSRLIQHILPTCLHYHTCCCHAIRLDLTNLLTKHSCNLYLGTVSSCQSDEKQVKNADVSKQLGVPLQVVTKHHGKCTSRCEQRSAMPCAINGPYMLRARAGWLVRSDNQAREVLSLLLLCCHDVTTYP